MNTPNDATDTQIDALTEGNPADAFDSAELQRLAYFAKVLDKVESLMHRKPDARAFDLSYDYASYRPAAEAWTCIDLNTYDGAPDSQAPCTFIGRGATEKAARDDLLEQFAEQDAEDNPKPRASRVIFSSQFEPPEYTPGTYQEWEDEDRE